MQINRTSLVKFVDFHLPVNDKSIHSHMYTTWRVCKEPLININFRTQLCFMDTQFFFIQESSFLYSPSEAQIKDKEVDHDILWREGKTFKV